MIATSLVIMFFLMYPLIYTLDDAALPARSARITPDMEAAIRSVVH